MQTDCEDECAKGAGQEEQLQAALVETAYYAPCTKKGHGCEDLHRICRIGHLNIEGLKYDDAEWRDNQKAYRSEVGRDAKVLLGATFGNSEACHDLVKAQQSAIFCAELPEALHISGQSANLPLPHNHICRGVHDVQSGMPTNSRHVGRQEDITLRSQTGH